MSKSSMAGLWVGAVALRIFNALMLKTYFDPDEYWQSLEVAHKWVFGYGWLTWEWRTRLRSALYPAIFALYYKILKLVQCDLSDAFVTWGPRVLQGLMGGTVDFLTFLVALRLTGSRKCAGSALFISLISWFNLAYTPRTLSNNLESLLSLFAMLLWPIEAPKSVKIKILLPLLLLGFSVLNRPSAAANWIFPFLILFWSLPGLSSKLSLVTITLVAATVVILIGAGIDYLYYQEWVFPWWNFVQFNVIDGLSSFYGVHPWHFYLSQAIPAIAGPTLPLCLLGLASGHRNVGWLLKWLAGSVFFASLIPHKEIRFMTPCAPILMILAGVGYQLLPHANVGGRGLKRLYLLFTLLTSILIGIYLGRIHGSGPLATIQYMREQVDCGGKVGAVYFAMPCHSTPFLATLHRSGVEMSFLTCEPPLNHRGSLENYRDESDIFYGDPAKALAHTLSSQTTITHVVMFEALLETPGMSALLTENQLRQCWRHFNSHWHPDPRRGGDVLIYCRPKPIV